VASVAKCWRQNAQISLSRGVVLSQSTFRLVIIITRFFGRLVDDHDALVGRSMADPLDDGTDQRQTLNAVDRACCRRRRQSMGRRLLASDRLVRLRRLAPTYSLFTHMHLSIAAISNPEELP